MTKLFQSYIDRANKKELKSNRHLSSLSVLEPELVEVIPELKSIRESLKDSDVIQIIKAQEKRERKLERNRRLK